MQIVITGISSGSFVELKGLPGYARVDGTIQIRTQNGSNTSVAVTLGVKEAIALSDAILAQVKFVKSHG